MAVCLDYQSVYARRDVLVISVRTQVFLALCIVCLLGFKIWMKIEATDIGYQLAKERNRSVALDLARRELELEKSVLVRSDHLESAARKRLGLRPLDPAQARRLTE
jgi:cell division protein FtsL